LHLLRPGPEQPDWCHENSPRPARSSCTICFAGFCFPADVIVLAVRWYLRFGLSYRDLEELLAERGIEVDHLTIHRWVLRSPRCSPRLPDPVGMSSETAAGRRDLSEGRGPLALCLPGDRPVRPGHRRVRLPRRDAVAARRFFERAVGTTRCTPTEVVTDRAAASPVVLEELLPAAWHRTDRYANNHIEADHGRLKSRLRAMRGFKRDRSARVVIAGHALVQNLRRGHYELAVEEPVTRRVAVAFDELALSI
jgi:transposase-like protein